MCIRQRKCMYGNSTAAKVRLAGTAHDPQGQVFQCVHVYPCRVTTYSSQLCASNLALCGSAEYVHIALTFWTQPTLSPSPPFPLSQLYSSPSLPFPLTSLYSSFSTPPLTLVSLLLTMNCPLAALVFSRFSASLLATLPWYHSS